MCPSAEDGSRPESADSRPAGLRHPTAGCKWVARVRLKGLWARPADAEPGWRGPGEVIAMLFRVKMSPRSHDRGDILTFGEPPMPV